MEAAETPSQETATASALKTAAPQEQVWAGQPTENQDKCQFDHRLRNGQNSGTDTWLGKDISRVLQPLDRQDFGRNPQLRYKWDIGQDAAGVTLPEFSLEGGSDTILVNQTHSLCDLIHFVKMVLEPFHSWPFISYGAGFLRWLIERAKDSSYSLCTRQLTWIVDSLQTDKGHRY